MAVVATVSSAGRILFGFWVIEERGEACLSGPIRSVGVGTKELRMPRRAVNPSSRASDRGLPIVSSLLHHKSRSPSVLTITLLMLGVIILIVYFNNGLPGGSRDPGRHPQDRRRHLPRRRLRYVCPQAHVRCA